jgi:hypothetical protein
VPPGTPHRHNEILTINIWPEQWADFTGTSEPRCVKRAKNFSSRTECGILSAISQTVGKISMIQHQTTVAGWSKNNRHHDRMPPAVSVGHRLRYCFWSFLLVSFALLCGCQTTTQSLFTTTGSGWHVQQGQALWRPQRGLPEFGGDLVLASDDAGRCLMQFEKTPMTILSAQTTSNRWLIKFPQRQMSFSGNGPGPVRFSWLYLPTALAGNPLPDALHFERQPAGGWRLENSRTGETLEGFLSP